MSSGYVYANVSSSWVSNKDGTRKHADHDKICIGVLVNKADKQKVNRSKVRMYKNDNYRRLFEKNEFPELPDKADSVMVGPYAVAQNISIEYGLGTLLGDVFGIECARMILDLALYMLVEEKAVFQHFPAWTWNHEIFSEDIYSDSTVSRLLKEPYITVSKINQFKKLWAIKVIGIGELYFCYDSTNVNSQAGVFLVQKGHAKDDPNMKQINTDYVVRQKDGLPVTFTQFPGSVNDIKQAPEMIEFFHRLLGDKCPEELRICLICDRGYISVENIISLDEANMDFLLILTRKMDLTAELIDRYGSEVKSSRNYIRELDQHGMTVTGKLFDDDTRIRYFHIMWNEDLAKSHKKELLAHIDSKEAEIKRYMNQKTRLSNEQVKNLSEFFGITTISDGTIQTNKRGRGKGTKVEPGFIISAYEREYDEIDIHLDRCGFYILTSSKKMTASEASERYSKRDCVEKVFQALKSALGMDKYGVSSDDSIHGKALIWFVASILHAVMFDKTSTLRVNNKKDYTLPAIIDQLDMIPADKELSSRKYTRRYAPTRKQTSILSAFGMTYEDIDHVIEDMV
jgi:transposase